MRSDRDGWVIRRAVPDDAELLAELGRRTFVDAFGAANRAEDIAEYLARTYGAEQQRREIADTNIVTLIVEDGPRMIGFAQLRTNDADGIEIARFYVDRAWHGRGVAHSLMNAALDAAVAVGATKIWLGVWEKNTRAIAFYARCGFRDVGSQPFLLGSDLQTDRIMVLFIPSASSRIASSASPCRRVARG